MPATIRKPKPTKKQEEIVEDVEVVVEPTAEELMEATEALLDEIDSLLEENAEEFVRNYVQKGGQ